MRYDDDALELALAALPLEEVPADLRGRILAATLVRPVPVFQAWELAVIAAALGLTFWLVLVIAGAPVAGGIHVTADIGGWTDRFGRVLASALTPVNALWLGLGVWAAIGLSFMTPGGRAEA
ncbi:MAG: hypothetical protein JO101_04445 [Candidatus Eremiobacteraeota bacterium]|nr:hypothetical protein [Candidatus Eremiobacteraeota bacterium]MBV8354547.1 hypothetical protein [Candidatus Eremiobacteraeota bacterium]